MTAQKINLALTTSFFLLLVKISDNETSHSCDMISNISSLVTLCFDNLSDDLNFVLSLQSNLTPGKQ